VDAFTSVVFKGNPAAVCLLSAPVPDATLQSIAAEMNLSETAFLLQEPEHFHLRWITPTTEVDLCGHATLASAHILWETSTLAKDQPARFQTKSGPLTCALLENTTQSGRWIEMDFPGEPPFLIEGAPVQKLLEALHHPIVAAPPRKNRLDYLVELGDEQAVRDFQPDLAAIAKLPARAVIITAHAHSPDYQFVSRFFAPAVGVPEDPVTGSAHCALAPYWSQKLNSPTLTGYQASLRGGLVRVTYAPPRVKIAGQAVTILSGQLAAAK
jgi:PhzF family phenazine biosynthesis protein